MSVAMALRKQILQHRELAQKLQLTAKQLAMLTTVSTMSAVTSTDFVRGGGRNALALASMQLRKLAELGYLERENVGCPAGGDMYVYTLADELRGHLP